MNKQAELRKAYEECSNLLTETAQVGMSFGETQPTTVDAYRRVIELCLARLRVDLMTVAAFNVVVDGDEE